MALTPHDLVVEAKSQIKEVSTAEAQALMTKRTIIDVREYDEFAAGHLPGRRDRVVARRVHEGNIYWIVRITDIEYFHVI